MRRPLKGKWTYIVAIVMAVYAFSGGFLGNLDATAVGNLLLEAAGLVGLRMGVAGVAKEEKRS